jgi:hypothetical protein
MIQKTQKAKRSFAEKREKIDKNVAFIEYKQIDEAKAIEVIIVNCRKELNNCRDDLRVKTDKTNLIKQEIDTVKDWLD